MKISELEKLNSLRTSSPWSPANDLEEKYLDDEDYCDTWTITPIEWETGHNKPGHGIHYDDANFIAAMANHADALLEVVKAARWVIQISSQSNLMALRDALEKLEGVK